ncbi:hypothetical protein MWN34_11425 [Ancylobacter sp. 6x-1]|uniref:Uncharacterized protein n=1 Tax=Ancylobacter crimeensis TaxID=2579147 RepID=A0ABT0DC58_9HYPH|nr:hypothetical protein [Ancylobacter crimeensis]MCK0197525.1 hypothetical protein [Ancylobacter crimeensis]
MNKLLRLLLRFLVVPFGIMVGMGVTMAIVALGYFDVMRAVPRIVATAEPFAFVHAASNVFVVLSALIMFIWALAIIPILCAEVFAIRSLLYHVMNVGICGWLAGQMLQPFGRSPADPNAGLYTVAAGFCGGLVYWIIGGWSAGYWKPIDRGRFTPAPDPRDAVPRPIPLELPTRVRPHRRGARIIQAEILPPDAPVPSDLRPLPGPLPGNGR